MKMKAKIILDVGMTLLFLLQMAYHLIGDSLHEWLGTVLLVLLILHNILDWKWYAGLRKGKYTLMRIMHTAINLLLLLVCTGIMVSAMMLSSTATVLFHLNTAMLGRKLHMLFTSWGFVLMSAHVGLHLHMVAKAVKKQIGDLQCWYQIIARLTVLLLLVHGLYSFLVRAIPQRMFLLLEYVSFNYEESFISFMVDHITILYLFASATYWLKKHLIQLHT